jgi:hypothetical protein
VTRWKKAESRVVSRFIGKRIPQEGHMASEQQKQELMGKVSTLVGSQYGGDYSIAFQHYADSNGKVGKDGVKALLKDAGIGRVLTRWAWAGALITELDGDGDGVISWPEFAVAFERQEGFAPHEGQDDRDPRPVERYNPSPHPGGPQ